MRSEPPFWWLVVGGVILVLGLLAFTVWFATECSAARGAHWWCWLG